MKVTPAPHPERSEGSSEFGRNQVNWRSLTAFGMTFLRIKGRS